MTQLPMLGHEGKKHGMRLCLGEYLLGETIGQGAYGKVKLGTHRQTGHKVAVKIIKVEKLATAKATTKVRREISILKALHHPHIIRLYEVVTTPTDIFMIMEYLPGGELFDYLARNGRIRQPLARKFFQQIICGVEYMHHFRVVHRDLKPENLLIDDNENVKIADFGLSNLTSDGRFLHTSCGSPNYAAPEVIMGRQYMGPEVDVWSCGVILYVMLVGRLPFDEDTIPALFSKIKEGVYPAPTFLDPVAKDLIAQMLVVDPLSRVTIPEIRRNPWFLESLPDYLLSAPEPGIVEIEPDLLLIVAGRMDIPYNVAHETITRGTKNSIYSAYELLLNASRHRRSRAMSVGASSAPDPKMHSVACSAPPSSGLYHRAHSPAQRPLTCPDRLKLQPSPIMTTFMSQGFLRTRESYNEPSSVGCSPSFLGSILSSTPTSVSFGMDVKDYMRLRKTSDPIGIPAVSQGQVDVGESPMIFCKEGVSLSSSPGMSQLTAAMAMHRAWMTNTTGPVPPEVPLETSVHQNWRLGLFTELPSNAAMREIYKVLHSLACSWKVQSPYHLAVHLHSGEAHTSEDTGDDIVIGIQLYRMQERHDQGYLVDFYVLSEEILPAVDQIHKLYLLLAAKIGA